MIGEYAKENGYTNTTRFSEEFIRKAAKAKGNADKSLIDELVFEEKLNGYDAIPKSGVLNSFYDRGVLAPLYSIGQLTSLAGEDKVETYLRTNKLSGTMGAQKSSRMPKVTWKVN